MVSYEVWWKRSVEEDLRKIGRQQIPHIIKTIETLKVNPLTFKCRKLQGAINFYRIRVGDYRVIYHVDSDVRKCTLRSSPLIKGLRSNPDNIKFGRVDNVRHSLRRIEVIKDN